MSAPSLAGACFRLLKMTSRPGSPLLLATSKMAAPGPAPSGDVFPLDAILDLITHRRGRIIYLASRSPRSSRLPGSAFHGACAISAILGALPSPRGKSKRVF
ncbi:hypothetical protein FKM82_031139 [Ascaphus truei]